MVSTSPAPVVHAPGSANPQSPERAAAQRELDALEAYLQERDIAKLNSEAVHIDSLYAQILAYKRQAGSGSEAAGILDAALARIELLGAAGSYWVDRAPADAFLLDIGAVVTHPNSLLANEILHNTFVDRVWRTPGRVAKRIKNVVRKAKGQPALPLGEPLQTRFAETSIGDFIGALDLAQDFGYVLEREYPQILERIAEIKAEKDPARLVRRTNYLLKQVERQTPSIMEAVRERLSAAAPPTPLVYVPGDFSRIEESHLWEALPETYRTEILGRFGNASGPLSVSESQVAELETELSIYQFLSHAERAGTPLDSAVNTLFEEGRISPDKNNPANYSLEVYRLFVEVKEGRMQHQEYKARVVDTLLPLFGGAVFGRAVHHLGEKEKARILQRLWKNYIVEEDQLASRGLLPLPSDISVYRTRGKWLEADRVSLPALTGTFIDRVRQKFYAKLTPEEIDSGEHLGELETLLHATFIPAQFSELDRANPPYRERGKPNPRTIYPTISPLEKAIRTELAVSDAGLLHYLPREMQLLVENAFRNSERKSGFEREGYLEALESALEVLYKLAEAQTIELASSGPDGSAKTVTKQRIVPVSSTALDREAADQFERMLRSSLDCYYDAVARAETFGDPELSAEVVPELRSALEAARDEAARLDPRSLQRRLADFALRKGCAREAYGVADELYCRQLLMREGISAVFSGDLCGSYELPVGDLLGRFYPAVERLAKRALGPNPTPHAKAAYELIVAEAKLVESELQRDSQERLAKATAEVLFSGDRELTKLVWLPQEQIPESVQIYNNCAQQSPIYAATYTAADRPEGLITFGVAAGKPVETIQYRQSRVFPTPYHVNVNGQQVVGNLPDFMKFVTR